MNREELEIKAKELGIKFPSNIGDETLKTKIEEVIASSNEEVETDEEVITISRVSRCGNYTVKIKTIEEAARRSNLTVEEVKEALKTSKLAGGYTFSKVI